MGESSSHKSPLHRIKRRDDFIIIIILMLDYRMRIMTDSLTVTGTPPAVQTEDGLRRDEESKRTGLKQRESTHKHRETHTCQFHLTPPI